MNSMIIILWYTKIQTKAIKQIIHIFSPRQKKTKGFNPTKLSINNLTLYY